MRTLAEALHKGKLKAGLIGAISECGALLAAHAPAGPENPDELPRRHRPNCRRFSGFGA